MAGRYERVNAQDEDDFNSPNSAPPRHPQPIPNSPPPSFHSRASSRDRAARGVDPTLADAFDTDGDDSDDDADDRQRLVRADSTHASANASRNSPSDARPHADRQVTQLPPTTASATGAPATPFRIYGSGIQNEGVFSNLTAKPERGGETKEEQPPTYEQAAADAAPPYWETTILAPGLGGPDEVYIDGMPVGSLFSFLWNGMISMSFQVVGFILTYLLHSTHAAKNGSRAGLGITLIQYGFYMKGTTEGDHPPKMNGQDGYAAPPDPNSHNFDPNAVTGEGGGGVTDITGQEWIAYILMVVGWFILIRSLSDYLKARRHEQLVLQSPDRGLPVPIIADGESSERVV
ncbi:metal homeostatis protein bsd2 [Colletotrichum incanum]|nr:metal homeostatis protein bsd2 [Colletotrichum incanum]